MDGDELNGPFVWKSEKEQIEDRMSRAGSAGIQSCYELVKYFTPFNI